MTTKTVGLRYMITRRKLFRSAAIAIAGTPLAAGAADSKASKALKADRAPPQLGDVLAYPSWENEGRVLAVSDVVVGHKPLLVYPHDPVAGITRERSRLNQLLVLRLGPTETSAQSEIVVYSGVCTHTACAVSEWDETSGHLICPCHASEFAPAQKAKVINGPAKRALPAIPVEVRDGAITITGGFSSRVGSKKKKSF